MKCAGCTAARCTGWPPECCASALPECAPEPRRRAPHAAAAPARRFPSAGLPRCGMGGRIFRTYGTAVEQRHAGPKPRTGGCGERPTGTPGPGPGPGSPSRRKFTDGECICSRTGETAWAPMGRQEGTPRGAPPSRWPRRYPRGGWEGVGEPPVGVRRAPPLPSCTLLPRAGKAARRWGGMKRSVACLPCACFPGGGGAARAGCGLCGGCPLPPGGRAKAPAQGGDAREGEEEGQRARTRSPIHRQELHTAPAHGIIWCRALTHLACLLSRPPSQAAPSRHHRPPHSLGHHPILTGPRCSRSACSVVQHAGHRGVGLQRRRVRRTRGVLRGYLRPAPPAACSPLRASEPGGRRAAPRITTACPCTVGSKPAAARVADGGGGKRNGRAQLGGGGRRGNDAHSIYQPLRVGRRTHSVHANLAKAVKITPPRAALGEFTAHAVCRAVGSLGRVATFPHAPHALANRAPPTTRQPCRARVPPPPTPRRS
jgi:hypothetical protein